MRVLVDTSVWSLALRRVGHVHNPAADELKRLITSHLTPTFEDDYDNQTVADVR